MNKAHPFILTYYERCLIFIFFGNQSHCPIHVADLLVNGRPEVPPGDDDGDDPEQPDEQQVEGGEQAEEAAHRRHPAVALRTGHDVVRDEHGNLKRREAGD